MSGNRPPLMVLNFILNLLISYRIKHKKRFYHYGYVQVHYYVLDNLPTEKKNDDDISMILRPTIMLNVFIFIASLFSNNIVNDFTKDYHYLTNNEKRLKANGITLKYSLKALFVNDDFEPCIVIYCKKNKINKMKLMGIFK